MSLLFLVFVVPGIVLGTCQELVYYGPKSSGADDAASNVRCPPAFYGVNCECSKDSSKCDGAYFHEDGNCRTHNTWKQGGIRARVTCEPLESLVRFTTVRSAGWVRDPEATCPLGSRLIHCGLHHPWMQDESNTEFDIISDTAQNQCKLGNKKCKKCALVARCASLEI